MESSIHPNLDNMVFDKEIQNMDLTEKRGFSDFMQRILDIETVFKNGKVDIVVIDPIYAITGGDLSAPKDVHTINHIIRTIQNRFECAVAYTHHTNRGGRDGGKRTEGDMYGNRFLSANLTGQFHLKQTEDGVDLNCTKNTYKNLLSHIPLIYDEMTQTLSMSHDSGDFNKRDKIFIFLRKKYAERKEFILREISNQLKVSDAYIRTALGPLLRTDHIVNKSAKGIKAVYFVEKSV
jgi:RecA-family ATPase